MAEFSKLVITNKGQALIAKVIAGEGNIDFTKISEKKIMPQTGIEPVRVSLPTGF